MNDDRIPLTVAPEEQSTRYQKGEEKSAYLSSPYIPLFIRQEPEMKEKCSLGSTNNAFTTRAEDFFKTIEDNPLK